VARTAASLSSHRQVGQWSAARLSAARICLSNPRTFSERFESRLERVGRTVIGPRPSSNELARVQVPGATRKQPNAQPTTDRNLATSSPSVPRRSHRMIRTPLPTCVSLADRGRCELAHEVLDAHERSVETQLLSSLRERDRLVQGFGAVGVCDHEARCQRSKDRNPIRFTCAAPMSRKLWFRWTRTIRCDRVRAIT
jgi:hypothetical protein